MFGKPEWFKYEKLGWLLRPKTRQGWFYAAAWAAAVSIPFLSLLARRQGPEAFVWLIGAIGLLRWDMASIRRSVPGFAERDVLYIGDDGQSAAGQTVARRFRFPFWK